MKAKLLFVVLILLATTTLKAQVAKYEVKSATIKKEMVAMGQKMECNWYIDDFGKKEAIELKVKVGGIANIEKNMRTISEGASVVNIDLDAKTAMRMKLPQEPINYLKLTPETVEKFKIKEIGTEDIAGKPCKKYSLEITQMGQTVQMTVWVWKGLVLKSETASNGMTLMVETSVAIDEGAAVPADKFTVPEGITLKE